MISQLYAGDVDDTELSNAMYKGMISGLGDKYSTYYTKEEYEAIKTAQEGYYQGIGVTVTLDGDKLQVTGVQDDTPAANTGIQADDRIVKIDGQTLEGLSLNDAVGLLKNSENDTVTLSIEREGEADLIETEVKKRSLRRLWQTVKCWTTRSAIWPSASLQGLPPSSSRKHTSHCRIRAWSA